MRYHQGSVKYLIGLKDEQERIEIGCIKVRDIMISRGQEKHVGLNGSEDGKQIERKLNGKKILKTSRHGYTVGNFNFEV